MQRSALSVCAVLALAPAAIAGDLQPPPGPINPTDHVVLNQQAITLPYLITQPGHYKLTSNLSGGPGDGIQIQSNDVWIDLNGFSLIGSGPAGIPSDGIVMLGNFENVTVVNGTLRDWGDDGIDFALGRNCRVERVTVAQSGDRGFDLWATQVIRCQAIDCGSDGIYAQYQSVVETCIVHGCGGVGIWAEDGCKIANCTSRGNIDGFYVGVQSVCIDSTALDNQSLGFLAVESSKTADCVAARNQLDGFVLPFGGVAVDCVATENGSIGFFADGGAVVTACKASRNTDGYVMIFGSKVVECNAHENVNLGVFADLGSVVRGCNVMLNFQAGIQALNACLIEDNHCFQNAGGAFGPGTANIEIQGSSNRVSGNDCKDAPSNYLVTGPGNTIYLNSATLFGPGGNFNIPVGPNDVAFIGPAAAGFPMQNVVY